MSEQSSTTTNTPSEPRLCKMGCGFFGSQATGGCCSKCYTDMIKQQGKEGGTSASTATSETCIAVPSSSTAATSTTTDTPSPMEVDAAEASPATTQEVQVSPAADATVTPTAETASSTPQPQTQKPKKKKKKKTSYKDMMATMTKRTKDEKDIQKEKEGLRKVTGGGAFSKIDKI